MHQALLSFNNGEVTDYLRHRIDFEKTSASAEVMENFIAMPYGGVIKRPGLQWLKGTETAGENSRLLPFVSADGSRYLLHFTVDTLTIYDTAGTVKDTLAFMDGYDWPGTMDWAESIRDLQMVQVNDVAFLTHPGTFPLRLSRVTDTEWVLEFLPFDRAPMLDGNLNKNRTFTVASDPVAATWADGEFYNDEDVVFTNCEWICVADHTASGSNKPGQGADWRDYWQRMFYEAGDPVTLISDERSEIAWSLLLTSWEAGDIVGHPSAGSPWAPYDALYYCHTSYTSSGDIGAGSDDPFYDGDTAGDQLNWSSILTWSTGPYTAIPGGGIVYPTSGVRYKAYHNGKIYHCKLNHYSTDAGSEPGVGASWATYWDEGPTIGTPAMWKMSRDYGVGARISLKGRVFICTVEHTPAAAYKPGVGADWEDVWAEVSRMVEEFSLSDFSPGQYFKIAPERDEQDFQVEIRAITDNDDTESDYIIVQGTWNFFTYGTWWGTFQLQRSTNGGTSWQTIRSWQSSGDRNVADSGEEISPCFMRLHFDKETASGETDAATGKKRGVLIPDNPYVTGYALMDTYVSADEMTGTAKTALMSGNTWQWSEGAFNARDGFPRAICLHESRLCFAATEARPVSIWLSQSDDLNNFETGVNATESIYATLALTAASPIRWMTSQRRLFLGTAYGEWAAGSETSDTPVTPANFAARQYSSYGTVGLQPVIANSAILFLERKGSRLRELAYVAAGESYDAVDLSRLAEHLTRPGISNYTWQQTREPGLWVVRRDGTLLHFAYSRTERITAWSRHTTTGGLFRDVAVLPSDDGDDEVFFIVDRGEGSHLERFPQDWQANAEADVDGLSYFHLDGVAGSGTTITIPDHLQDISLTKVTVPAATPTALPTVATATFASGAATIASADWQIGFPIVSRLRSLPIDSQAQDGTTQARRKRTHKLLLSLHRARGGYVWNTLESRKQPVFNSQTDEVLRSGWEETIPDAGHLDDLQLNLYHADPFPFCVRSAVMRWVLHEK